MKRYLVPALLVALALPARADTLYVAAPPPAAAGHPLRLGADRKAQQVGDLVQVVFDFTVNSASTDTVTQNNNYTLGINGGTGVLNLPLVRLGAGLGGTKGSGTAHTGTNTNTFTSVMEATVTDVLPSGALAIAGDQKLIVNNLPQTLHITGLVRPEDIDGTDAVLSTRVANVQANFTGNTADHKNNGLLHKVLDFLF